MDIVSSLSIVSSVGIGLASIQLVLGSRASRRRRRRQERDRVAIIKTSMCAYTHILFGDTCPVPSYKPPEYQAELWAFHQAHCIPKESSNNYVAAFMCIFMLAALLLFTCFIAR